MRGSGFNYQQRQIDAADSVDVAIRKSLGNCLHDQLGWSLEACEAQAIKEEQRRIPRQIIRHLRDERSWRFDGARVLDLGAGLGGLALELLHEHADVAGVEPFDQFRTVAQKRLEQDGFGAERIVDGLGEDLPFPDAHFDYVISLQVLEHVRKPELVLREIFRVLKSGGRCYISCENYLAFREQEYRVAWVPLLPKPLAARYLRLRRRDPSFLLDHVFYTTYPQVWRLARRAGFINETYGRDQHSRLRQAVAHVVGHAQNLFRVGVRVHLLKAL